MSNYNNGTSGYPRSAQKLRVENALKEITDNATLKAAALANLGLTDVAGNNVAVATGKTFNVSNTLTLAGTDGTTVTFPSTSSTAARTDAANTFTGNQTITGTVSVADATTPSVTTASGKTNTGKFVVSGKTSGSLVVTTADATAQTLTVSGAAQTVGAATLTIPDLANVSDTVALLTKAQTLASKTLTSPVISTGLTASGSASNDFSASTGTFKTSTGAVTIGGAATFPAGTATAATAPIYLTSGTNLTAAAAGAIEYDGTNSYMTNETTSGRGLFGVHQYFGLQANGSTISTIANFFGTTSNISLASGGYYDIDIYAWFLNSTSGTVVWTFTNSAAPTKQNIYYESSPVTGVVAPPGTATTLVGQVVGDSTAALALTATSAITDAINMYTRFKIFLKNGTGTSLKIQATKSAGTITPLLGSYWTCRRLPASNVGSFAA